MITIQWTEVSVAQSPLGGDVVSALGSALELDILSAGAYSVTSSVTSHAIEAGAAITDHQVPELDQVRLDVVVSDSPMSVAQGLLGTAWQGLDSGATVLISPDTSKASIAFDTLHRLCREGIEVDIIGLRRGIEKWLITSVSDDWRVETAGALVVSITAQEVATATLTEVDAPAPQVERVRPSTDAGQQAASVAGDSTVSTDVADRDEALQSCRDDYYAEQAREVGY